jgi:hypothetical protein
MGLSGKRLRLPVTDDAKFVALGISKISAVVVLVVVRSQPRLAFRNAPIGESNLMGIIDARSIRGQEGDHLPIAGGVRQPVVRRANKKERPRSAGTLPTGPGPTAVTETGLDSKAPHQRAVEAESPFEVRYADEDV